MGQGKLKKYKTFGYEPRHKYTYLIYTKEGLPIYECNNCTEIEELFPIKKQSLIQQFSRLKTNEIKINGGYTIYRERN